MSSMITITVVTNEGQAGSRSVNLESRVLRHISDESLGRMVKDMVNDSKVYGGEKHG